MAITALHAEKNFGTKANVPSQPLTHELGVEVINAYDHVLLSADRKHASFLYSKLFSLSLWVSLSVL